MVRALNRPRALLRGVFAAAGALLLVTCTESPMAPRGHAALAVRPSWSGSVRFAPLLLDRARLVVTDPAADQVLLDVTRPFDPASNQLTLDEVVPLSAATLDVVVTLELYAGPTLLFSGQSNVTLARGGANRPATPVLGYVGPGANAALVVVGPRDSVVRPGATIAMRATASDSTQQPVADFYAHWSVIGAVSATIDAAGSLSTGATRDTFFVKALLPNGVTDSARLFVLPAPATLVKQGGDNQTGSTGARLAQPLAVLVNGSDGFPVPGVTVTFAAAIGGGSVDSASATTDAQGIARTGATLGTAVGSQTFTASATGLTAVTFTATATALTTTRTWNGATSSDWSVAANWTPASVPTNANDVVIPAGTPNGPTITASCSALSLTVNATATLSLGAANCQVGGNVFADGQITGTGAVQMAATSQVRGRISNLQVSGAVTAVGQLSVSGNVTTTGATGDLIMNGQKANISGNLTTQGGALFTMTNTLDTVQVLGNALFSGGSTAGHLTQGALILGGGFTQSTTASSFSAGGNHRVAILGAGNHLISFSDPVNSRFQALDLGSNAATYALASNVTVLGQLLSKPTGLTPPVVTTANGSVLTAGGADITLLTFSGVPLVLSGGTIGSFSNVVFSSQPTNRAQLTVNNTGAGGPFTFTGVSFSTTPVAPNGYYLDVTDLDGATNGSLTITMATPSPASPGGFLRTSGGAVVNWPGTTTLTWTGAVNSDFTAAGNWSPAVAPTTTSDIVIPPTTTSPVAASNLTIRSLTVNPGATFNIGLNTLNVNGSVLIDGAIGGGGTLQQIGAGQLRGSVPALVIGAPVTVTGPVATTAGNLNISSGGNLILGGHTVTTSASVNTVNGGVLTMTNALDTVIAVNVGFGGGDQAGLLTAGAIRLSGNLSTTGSTPATRGPLTATGTHTVILTGAATHLMQALGGATVLSLANLDVSATTGSIGVTTLTATPASLQMTGTLTAKPTAAPVVFHGVATATVQARSVNISRLGVDTMRFIVGQTGVTITQFDSVAFTNQDPAQTQLTVSHPGSATPFTFHALTFGTTPSSGRYLDAVDEAPADGQVLTLNIVGATPPAPSTGLLGTVGGAVINWPPAAPATVWTGSVSGDWSVAGNWSTNAVPGATDSVVIPVTATTPFLSALVTVGAVNIAGGTLRLGGQSLIVNQTFTTTANGKLNMTDPGDVLVVGGNAIFAGGDETGLLTEGGVNVGGNFTQLAGTSVNSYAASGNHVTLMSGTSPTVSFASPLASQSHFFNFSWSGVGSLTLLSNVTVLGTAVTTNGTSTITSTGGLRLTAGQFANANPVTFNNVPLTIDNAAGDAIALNNLTFQNMATNVSQLAIRHPGLGSSFTFTGLVFSTTPVAPNGFYLDVNDVTGAADGGLTIQVTATPSSPGGFVTTAGGAVVEWPGPQNITWTGAVNTDWNTAGNWSSNAVPAAIDQVVIGPAANQPTLQANVTVGSVRVSGAGARLTLNGRTLTANGVITDTDGLLVMTNPADLAILGSAAFQGGNETGLLTAGEMRIAGDFTVGQQTTSLAFRPSGSHRVVMTNPSQLQTISICCTAGASGFQNLDISQSFGINIQFSANGVFVADTFIAAPGAGPRPWLYMLGSPLTARRLRVNNLLVDRGTITLNEQGVAGNVQFDNVTFQNYLATQTQMTMVVPGGAPRTLTFNNVQFQTLAAGSTGRYLNITSTTGSLVLNLPGNGQINGPAFTTTAGTVTVNWPASAFTWTGATSTAWNVASNWSPAAVPGAIDSVMIPLATNAPVLTTAVSVGAVSLTGGTLDLNGQTLTVARSFNTSGTGRYSSPAGSLLLVGASANFNGGDETGLLNAGELRVGGTFSQSGPGTTFLAGGSHLTTLNGSGPQNMLIFDRVVTAFQNLTIANVGGALPNFGSKVTAKGTITLAAGASLQGNAHVAAAALTAPAGTILALDTLTVPAAALSVAGTYVVGQTNLTGGGSMPALPYTNLVAAGPGSYGTSGNLSVTGNFELQAPYNVGNFTATVGGTFRTTGAGQLQMTDAGSVFNADSASFEGADESLVLSGGTFSTRALTTSGTGTYFATGVTTNLVPRTLGTGRVNFSNPSTSRFAGLSIQTQATITSDITVSGNLSVNIPSPTNSTAKRVTVAGTYTQAGSGAFRPARLTLQGASSVTGDVLTADTLEFAGTAPQTMPAGATNTLQTVLVANDVTVGAAVTNIGADLRILAGGTFRMGATGATFNVGGRLSTAGSGVLQMTDPGATLAVAGDVSFAGGSTNGLLTAGTLRLSGAFTQSATSSVLSFAPSGTHKTVFSNTTAKAVSMGSPGLTTNGSHFQVLDVTQATGGITLDVNLAADSLISTATSAKIASPGVNLTVRRAQVTGLTFTNTSLVLDEQGVINAENLSNVSFSGFTTPITGVTMLTVIGPGNSFAARPAVTTTNMNFQTMPVGAGNFYVDLTSSNSAAFNLNMTTSNQSTAASGNGAALTRVTPNTGIATVTW